MIALIASVASGEEIVSQPQQSVQSADEDLENRLQSIEAGNRKLTEQFDRVLKENESLLRRLRLMKNENSELAGKYEDLSARFGALAAPAGIEPAQALTDPVPNTVAAPNSTWFEGQPPDIRTDEPAPKKSSSATKSTFHEGFKWETEDGEYSLNFHNETQLETRIYTQSNSDPVNQVGFDIPRVRFIFNGRLSKPIEYNVSLNKGLGSLDLLDAYLNFNYDSRFQFRFGRYRVPFTYDWFALSNQFLTTPERSVWAINEGYNRNFAAMFHGELLDDRLEYAFALANGPRNSYFDTNAGKDLLSYLNFRPFGQSEQYPELKHLNLGGSMTYGQQNQSPLPVDFRTSVNATESAGTLESAPSFLQLNDDVREQGTRKLWELHAAYYYKQLSLLGAYDSGYNDYVQTTTGTSVRVPTRGYHMQFGYFLTGEEVERRTFVEPLEPFDLREGRRGLGAIELQARFDHFSLGDQVFNGGLADPNLWTNTVNTVDSGVNWYLNKYTKVYFDWQHAMFANPVQYRPGGLARTSNLFWIRCQIYF
ncbi:MAG: porin [Planctomycetota bacterium]